MSKRKGRTNNSSHLSIRMYNVGFGDCFLLRIPTTAGERRMLVDCGYHSKGKGKFSDRELVAKITQDLQGQPLNVVVATHRHQDHISGYGEPDLWAAIGVDEVWLPFTVDPSAADRDPGLRAWNGLMNLAERLLKKNGSLSVAAADFLGARSDEERDAAAFMLWNARTNAPGIKNLLTGMKKSNGQPALRRFLPGPNDGFPAEFTTPALPGVKVHVLGPPQDPAKRKAKKVPSSWGFADGFGASAANAGSPFPVEWRIPEKRLPSRRPLNETAIRQIRQFNDDLLLAASALEGFLNGESLVLILEIGNARILLPGDAEVGTWQTILENPDALALASSATLLKVGHHGSHNATPLIFVREHLAKKTPALLSTQQGSGTFRNGIPFGDLLTGMKKQKMPLARSDQPPAASGSIFQPDTNGFFVDCTIPI
jgi:beta-lactamase superfamily II metal-dependent hydrolase